MTDEKKQAEFIKMLRQSESILLRLCLCLGRRDGNADDLYQDVVCQLWERWHTYKGDSSPKTWAVRVALNTIGQQERWNRHKPRYVEMDIKQFESIVDEPDDPYLETLYRLIDRLKDSERKLLMLYLEDMSLAEIAYATGLGENAAKQKIYRIKKKLITLKEEVENE